MTVLAKTSSNLLKTWNRKQSLKVNIYTYTITNNVVTTVFWAITPVSSEDSPTLWRTYLLHIQGRGRKQLSASSDKLTISF
jgi:hypothetical protein